MSQQGDQLSIHFSLAKNNSFASGLDLPYCLIYVDCKEGRTPKNWCCWTVVLEETPKSPLDFKIKPILREISLEYSLERLRLKLQYFGHLLLTHNSLEKSLMLGKIEGRRRRRHWRMRCLDSIINVMNKNLGKPWEMVRDRGPGVLQYMGLQRVRHNWVSEQQRQCWLAALSLFSQCINIPDHTLRDNLNKLYDIGICHSAKKNLHEIFKVYLRRPYFQNFLSRIFIFC